MKSSYSYVAAAWFQFVLCWSRIPVEAFAPSLRPLFHTHPFQGYVVSRHGVQPKAYRVSSTNRHVNAELRPSFMVGINAQEVVSSVFRNSGPVPLLQSFAVNALLFNLARSKLLSALTPSGYVHAMILGTTLWMTLGWRGWLYCVLYLIFGQIVTKVGFATKEKRGIAESRYVRINWRNISITL